MRHIRLLALSTAAILAAGTVSAEAFERYRYGEFGDGLFGENDFFGQALGNGLASIGLATSGIGYSYSNGYPFYGATYGYNTYATPIYYPQPPAYVYTKVDYGMNSTSMPSRYLVVTGRSAAIGGFGRYCSTPVKTCMLYEPSMMGGGCSCKVEGGRSRGNVTP